MLWPAFADARLKRLLLRQKVELPALVAVRYQLGGQHLLH